jgi:hypothetical protein
LSSPEPQIIFGDSQRYYAIAPTAQRSSKSPAQQVAEATITRLLSSYQQDWRERVTRTFKQWNNILRDYLRNETALRLTVGNEQQSVPVRVKDGLPQPFAEIVSDYDDPLIWKLYLNRSVLAASVKGLQLVEANAPAISLLEGMEWTNATPEELQHARDLFEKINAHLEKLALINRIRGLNSDTLGAYFFRIPEIQLYWMVIGLMAGILNVSVEALTVVILTHELTHAYTHLGRDIDGGRWDTESFAKADLQIVEGLAQFYAAVICDKLASRFPAAQHAFNALLKMQSGAYLVHDRWTEKTERGGEVVRFAMIATRSRKLIRYTEWESELASARPQMGRRKMKAAAEGE